MPLRRLCWVGQHQQPTWLGVVCFFLYAGFLMILCFNLQLCLQSTTLEVNFLKGFPKCSVGAHARLMERFAGTHARITGSLASAPAGSGFLT